MLTYLSEIAMNEKMADGWQIIKHLNFLKELDSKDLHFYLKILTKNANLCDSPLPDISVPVFNFLGAVR